MRRFLPLTLLLLAACAAVPAFAGGGVNLGTLRAFVEAIFNGPINITGQTTGQAIAWNGAAWTAQTVATPTPDWATVLAAGNTSGANDAIIDVNQGLVIGGATTAGVRLEVNSGDLYIREGDDSGFGPNVWATSFIASPDAQLLSNQLNFTAGAFIGTLTNDSLTVRTNGTNAWQFQQDGDLLDMSSADGGNAIILRSADTAGIRLEVNSGFLDVREGDDSALATLRASSINVTSCIAASGGLTVGAIAGSVVFAANATNVVDLTVSELAPRTDSSYNSGSPTARWLGVYTDFTANQTLVATANPTALSATGAELVVGDTSVGAVEFDLPAVAGVPEGRRYVIKRVGGANVTVDPNGTELIDGSSTTYTLSVDYQSVTIFRATVGGTAQWLIE